MNKRAIGEDTEKAKQSEKEQRERERKRERAERTHLIGAIGDEQTCDRRGTNDVNEIAIQGERENEQKREERNSEKWKSEK